MNGGEVERSRVWQEALRLRAWELVQPGWKQIDVAEALGVTRGAVSQAQEGGWKPCAAASLRRVVQAQWRTTDPTAPIVGARAWAGAFGFCGEIWTRQRVAQVSEGVWGVAYHPSQAGRILRGLGWSWQQPALRAAQREEEAIREWRELRYPQLKERP